MDCLNFVVVFKGSVADYGWDELDTESMSDFALDVLRMWDFLSVSVGEYIKGQVFSSLKTEVVARNREEYIQSYIIELKLDTIESILHVENMIKEAEGLSKKGYTPEGALAYIISDICDKYLESYVSVDKIDKVKIASVQPLYQYLCGALERDGEQGKL